MMEHFILMKIQLNSGKQKMSKITNEENEWDEVVDADTVEGPIESDERRDNGSNQTYGHLKGNWAIRTLCRNDSR